MTNTIQIDGETINIEIQARPTSSPLRTVLLTATHAEGGRVDFEIVLHQCVFTARLLTENSDTPAEVCEAVRGICRRASAWYGKLPSYQSVTMADALLNSQVIAS